MSTEVDVRPGIIEQAAQLFTPHQVDTYLRMLRPTWSLGDIKAEVTHVHRNARGSVTLVLRPNRRWQGFRAGQFVMVTVEVDGVRHTRCFSPANAEQEARRVELTVKANPDGIVSRYLVDHAEPGLVVGLSAAQGEFTLPGTRPRRLLLVSGGSGLTPVMSMLRTLCREGHEAPVTFLHYSLTAAAMPYRDEVAAIAVAHPKVRVVRAFVEEPGRGDVDGLFSAGQLAAVDPGWAEAEVFTCGPAPLMAAVEAHYRAAGLGDRVHQEAFVIAPAEPDPLAAAATGVLRFAASGTEVASDGRTILEQAEAAGLRPASGCRMGICHTCPRALRRGTVRNVQDGSTTEAGTTVRICVSAPAGDIDIDL